QDLMARLVQGDEAALREIYRAYASAVFGLAVRVLNDSSLAEEGTPGVFVRLWGQTERFAPPRGSFGAFMLAIAHSRAVERVRLEDSLRRRHAAARQQPREEHVDDPAKLIANSQVHDAVQEALHKLPQDQRTAIEMAYFEGLSYRDVA